MVEILKNAISITVFVTVMMMVIEYFNVRTKGNWTNKLENNKFTQILLAAVFGVIPGCLGTYTIVSLYTHGAFSFGAIVTSMIATFGDEAFIMFAMMPKQTIIISIVLFIVAILIGILTNLIFKNKYNKEKTHMHLHKEDECICYERNGLIKNLKNISFERALLIFSITIFLGYIIFSGTGHHHHTPVAFENMKKVEQKVIENNIADNHIEIHKKKEHKIPWVKITFIVISLIALFIILTVPEHFLDEHLWKHIILKHFLKIFLWTLGVLTFVYVLDIFIDVEELVKNNLHWVLIFAVLIGIIPESGPHLVFVSLFLTGTIPLSILMANSIVQDGHGALPLFAEDKKAFFIMKVINVVIGYIIGLSGWYFGF